MYVLGKCSWKEPLKVGKLGTNEFGNKGLTWKEKNEVGNYGKSFQLNDLLCIKRNLDTIFQLYDLSN